MIDVLKAVYSPQQCKSTRLQCQHLYLLVILALCIIMLPVLKRAASNSAKCTRGRSSVVEHLAFNQGVVSSILTALTKIHATKISPDIMHANNH